MFQKKKISVCCGDNILKMRIFRGHVLYNNIGHTVFYGDGERVTTVMVVGSRRKKIGKEARTAKREKKCN